jgi:hypothetical protein
LFRCDPLRQHVVRKLTDIFGRVFQGIEVGSLADDATQLTQADTLQGEQSPFSESRPISLPLFGRPGCAGSRARAMTSAASYASAWGGRVTGSGLITWRKRRVQIQIRQGDPAEHVVQRKDA